MRSLPATPFSLLLWSLSIPALFFLIQAVLASFFGVFGYRPTPSLSLVTWFAVSLAIASRLYIRHHPRFHQMMLLQALACINVGLLSFAVALSSEPAVSAGQAAAKGGVTSLVLFLSGAIAFSFAPFLFRRRAS